MIKLNVSGKVFTTTKKTLSLSTYFKSIFSGKFTIDRDGGMFEIILKHLKSKLEIKINYDEKHLINEFKFYDQYHKIIYPERITIEFHKSVYNKETDYEINDRMFREKIRQLDLNTSSDTPKLKFVSYTKKFLKITPYIEEIYNLKINSIENLAKLISYDKTNHIIRHIDREHTHNNNLLYSFTTKFKSLLS